MKPFFACSGIWKSFRKGGESRLVLPGVSVAIPRGGVLALIGASGCGKTTLLNILAGFDAPDAGTVTLEGRPCGGPGPDRAVVFQEPALFPWLTVCRNVMFGLETAGYSRDGAENMALQWLDIIGLEKYADYYPGQLSGGMQQRVAIARALAPQPRVLLMDEPFGALDAQTRAQMQNYLLEVWHNIDITVIFVTHDLDEAVYLSDRILALKANPGEVNEVIEVPVPRPRSPDMLLSPEFQATRRHIDELINPNRRAQKPDFKIINMVGTRNYL